MQTADFIARKNFTEEEVKKTLDAFNFLDMRPKTAEEIKTDSNSSKP
jgi:hypothetical protein